MIQGEGVTGIRRKKFTIYNLQFIIYNFQLTSKDQLKSTNRIYDFGFRSR
jgi:hypothetical protein